MEKDAARYLAVASVAAAAGALLALKLFGQRRAPPPKRQRASSAPTEIDGTDAAQLEALLGGLDAVVFDCDGVLWQGSKALPGMAEVIAMLRARGKKLMFVVCYRLCCFAGAILLPSNQLPSSPAACPCCHPLQSERAG